MKQNMRQNRNMLQEKGRDVKQYDGTTIKEEFIVSDMISSGNSSTGKVVPNLPQKTYRAGGIKATVWKNSTQNGDKSYTTVSLERVYQDREGTWKSTNSLRLNDLPKVASVMDRAYADLIIKEQDLFKAEVA